MSKLLEFPILHQGGRKCLLMSYVRKSLKFAQLLCCVAQGKSSNILSQVQKVRKPVKRKEVQIPASLLMHMNQQSAPDDRDDDSHVTVRRRTNIITNVDE